MEDFHIISSTESEPKRRSPIVTVIPVIFVLALIFVGFGYTRLNTRESVQGVQTESSQESIKFETPEATLQTETESVSGISTPTIQITGMGTTKTVILKSAGTTDGNVSDEGLVGVHTAIKIGDDGINNYRGFVSFDLNNLPQGTLVTKAIIRLYQTQIKGIPFGNHGTMKVDHLVFGNTLTSDSYAKESEKREFATIPQTSLAGWKEIEVTEELKNDIQKARTQSQYRIHFTNEKVKGTLENMVYFESASNSEGSGETPQLVVTY